MNKDKRKYGEGTYFSPLLLGYYGVSSISSQRRYELEKMYNYIKLNSLFMNLDNTIPILFIFQKYYYLFPSPIPHYLYIFLSIRRWAHFLLPSRSSKREQLWLWCKFPLSTLLWRQWLPKPQLWLGNWDLLLWSMKRELVLLYLNFNFL